MTTTPLFFFGLTPETLATACSEHDLPSYCADQLLDWVYKKGIVEPSAMSNIARRHQETIARVFRFETASVAAHQQASDGTQKLLLTWDGDDPTRLPVAGNPERQTECVMIPTEKRRTACISSQVGCPVGCRFCASGLGGLEGNLPAARIIEQVHRLGRLPAVGRITNVVFMGMGEPLANYRAVTDAVRTLNAPWGLGIGARRITISTVGLPGAIHKLVDFELPVTLALSLHAPNDALRRELIPWAEYSTINELLTACDAWFQKTGREITFEYLLLREVNDQPTHAHQLVSIATRIRANVNLIRYNEVSGLPFDRPRTADVLEFQRILKAGGISTHIRASRGRDISAACGQLRYERRSGSSAATDAS